MWIENGRKFSGLQESQTRLVVAENFQICGRVRLPSGPLLPLAMTVVHASRRLTLSASL
jgi:hypothetical protein